MISFQLFSASFLPNPAIEVGMWIFHNFFNDIVPLALKKYQILRINPSLEKDNTRVNRVIRSHRFDIGCCGR